ncbi:ribbon-helix-helix protein, CopG family [Hallerella succinigenes]|uniref:Ribbon-helix-helix CopG family protein n=1 Tax=Hallerella succinigenes TaxID=1896222 RepID=A0A2M9A9L2_9BACT|nr:ribbon-helix-helix protein, CopG family [Hallerella succinigenes]PJJ42374.1 ribbon-helix-helix CopG family protein [Hallerella succinigenes]
MADRVHIAVPAETAEKVKELAEKLDETKGKIVRMAVEEFAKKEKANG